MVVHDDKTNKIPHFSEQNIFQINSSKVKKNKKNFDSNENSFEFQERRTQPSYKLYSSKVSLPIHKQLESSSMKYFHERINRLQV